jgi:pimeloyl-ACP methyl ester carboxylesterase
VPSLTFKHDGLRLAYDVVGEGFPVILHTGAGGDSRMWRDAGYVDALGGYMVVLFDHRGHGASDAPTDPRAYLPEHHAADVVALADHLGLHRFAFWGYSAGARFGFRLAATRPDRVAGLIARGTVDAEDADPTEWLTDAQSARVKGLEPILDDESIPQWLRENLLSTDNEVLARGFECFADWSPWPLFARITAPVLIVAGELEDEGCAQAAARIARGRAVILPELGHIDAFVQSQRVLQHALPFLDEVRTRAS